MSGLIGAFFRDGRPLDSSVLSGMLEAIAYRGPDGCSVWHEGSLGLGHLMLHTTPESLHEKLPKSDESGRFVITADARIDNRDELMSRLGMESRPADVVDDSRIILQAHHKWGESAAAQLEGDFAYCIWDRTENKLFCCRDVFGARPFYYYLADRIFAFGSEIRSLLKLHDVPRRLDETMVADYLVGLQDDQAITFYRNILRLPPGHCMIVSSHEAQIRRFWSPDPNRELRLSSDEEYAEAFRDLFIKAVHCRLRSVYPVATTLSGGLDSSSVTCVARNLLAQVGISPLTTLSLIYDRFSECDERNFIKYVVAQGGVRPLYFSADDSISSQPFSFSGPSDHDDPFDAPPPLLTSLAGGLWEQGIRIVLDGFDGDNTVSHGHAYLAELAAHGKLITLVREVRALSLRHGGSFSDLLWRKAIRPLTPAVVRRTWRRLKGNWNRPWPKESLISEAFAERIGFSERYRELQAFWLKPVNNAREEHCHSLFWGGLTHTVESGNKLAARYFIEPAHPFFDRRLAEFCTAIPHGQKISDGWTRLVIRKGMAGILPEEIQWRVGKVNFIRSLTHAIVDIDSALLNAMLHDCAKALEEYVDPEAVNRSFGGFLSNPLSYDPSFLWPILSLGLWLHRSSLKP
ncbi:MAG: lasso peptide isopeptide bond-forming cyclase [Desulfomonilaceae bacterium]